MKGFFECVNFEFFRRYNINFDLENTLFNFDKLIAGAKKIIKAKWKIRDFVCGDLPSDRINELINKFDGSHRIEKNNNKLFGKIKSKNNRMEELIDRFSKLIINDFTKILN